MPDTTHSIALPCPSALVTDLYELTMAAAYFENNFAANATFELFVRSLPNDRGYLLFAGLEQALEFMEQVRFKPEEIDFIRRHPVFKHVSDAFFDYLRDFRFTGEVWAIRDGTPIFAQEPLLRVTAPIIEAQLVETFLLNSVAFPTMIATKAARLVEAAQGRAVIEFGTRRAHGAQAGLLAARASYVGGCVGTSNVEAGFHYGIPTYGTVAHSFIMAYGDEEEAFRRFCDVYPDDSILLIDTYDTKRAVEKIIAMELQPKAVRLDSGDLAEQSKMVRRMLDSAGLQDTKIFASGDLDEFIITRMLAQHAPIDFFAVGTALVTSKDAPSLGAVYKLVEIKQNGQTRYAAKFSEDKVTYPGKKQVFRFSDARDCYERDVIARESESHPGAQPLLECMMRNGERTDPAPALKEVREHASESLRRLPARYRELKDSSKYPVAFSDQLERLLKQVKDEVASGG
ncbi:MAG TPA: nicotinate phosphoribosyltransferase [Terriglobales bacterium]|nr:nicotinate phosphoribosyltransferase [Terriglobales bacterium]